MKKVLIGILAIIAIGIYYYVTLPAINIHAAGFWYFFLGIVIAAIAIRVIRIAIGKSNGFNGNIELYITKEDFKKSISLKILIGLFAVILVVYIVGYLLSSPFFNAAKYQQLLSISEGVFTEDIKEVDYNTIPLLDKNSAS